MTDYHGSNLERDDLLRKIKDLGHELNEARRYMSHDQKCQFKFGKCTCGYNEFLKRVHHD